MMRKNSSPRNEADLEGGGGDSDDDGKARVAAWRGRATVAVERFRRRVIERARGAREGAERRLDRGECPRLLDAALAAWAALALVSLLLGWARGRSAALGSGLAVCGCAGLARLGARAGDGSGLHRGVRLGRRLRAAFWRWNAANGWIAPAAVDAVARCAATVEGGDAAGVLATLDAMGYAGEGDFGQCGDGAGAILDSCFGDGYACFGDESADEAPESASPEAAAPKYAPRCGVEFGGGAGYATVRIARWLGEGSVLHSVDPDATQAAVRVALAALAGVAGVLRPAVARSTEWIRAWDKGGRRRTIDFLYLDHDPELYRSDLDLLLKYDLLKKGCVVAADKCAHPAAADFLRLVSTDARFRATVHETSRPYDAAGAADSFVVAAYQGRRSDAYAATP